MVAFNDSKLYKVFKKQYLKILECFIQLSPQKVDNFFI